MVVLAPGHIIRSEDIPDEVRAGRGPSLLPAPIPRATREGTGDLRPELEFVLRTLVDLRVDMDDLRREFDVYRRGEGIALPGEPVLGQVAPGWAVDDLEVGMEVELVTGVLYEDEEREYLTWQWRPLGELPVSGGGDADG
jgi:hypothetical protein